MFYVAYLQCHVQQNVLKFTLGILFLFVFPENILSDLMKTTQISLFPDH